MNASYDKEKSSRKRHRGANGDSAAFAEKFVAARLAGFKKDIEICLTGIPSETRSGLTHAYFPALSACCGTMEYMTALHRGDANGNGWQQVARWAERYLPQPEYDQDTVRVLFVAFRNTVAHRGIASGVWVDRNQGEGHGRRITWRLLADSRRPACELMRDDGVLVKDTPWTCGYTHRLYIHIRGLSVDIRNAADQYRKSLISDEQLLRNFKACMRQLYPQ